jgi:hypothetical protein
MITSQYHAYLMRIWQSAEFAETKLFISLEDPTTHKFTYFMDMDEFFVFLREVLSGNTDNPYVPKNSNQ